MNSSPNHESLYIISSFTAQPIQDHLDKWCRALDYRLPIFVAPSGQALQLLLDLRALPAHNRGTNILLVRLEDLCFVEGDHSHIQRAAGAAAEELRQAVLDHLSFSAADLLVIVCPASPHFSAVCEPAVLSSLEHSLRLGLSDVERITVFTSEEIAPPSDPARYHDDYSLREGLIPYISHGYEAIARAVARYLHALLYADKYKVVVADCDNTLWDGVCGEAGPDGIQVDRSRKALQAELVRQVDLGRLVCLCSKNNEADVWNVFDHRTDMPLKRKHITAHLINWRPKYQNIQELAEDLGVTLDSIVFLDDDPAVCAEVTSMLPGVLSFQMPAGEELEGLLKRLWVFDKFHTTTEDKSRTLHYREEKIRNHAREAATSYAEFLNGLNLRVEVSESQKSDIERIAQLLMRTTQFNSMSSHWRVDMLRKALQEDDLRSLSIHVRDRFGEYGLVGAVLFRVTEAALSVETIALSCRVLGRGVEDHIWRALVELAAKSNRRTVSCLFRKTDRNTPVLDFLRRGCSVEKPISEAVSIFEYHRQGVEKGSQ